MDLLLWRHAEAEEGPVDLQRKLTARGEKQALAMAAWIKKNQPKKLCILVSPAVRCQQTAKALGLAFETVRGLAPDAGVSELIAATGWPTASAAVLVVGHQPTLGHMASLALAGQEADWTIKKGALWWLNRRERAGESQTVLRASITPDLL
ncbi:MAG TPA: histidine phosphatase family protein [Rhodocyclaceae bacterium]|nr:histidine phosphatase family protein [Rhodocyclaceae bacterium]